VSSESSSRTIIAMGSAFAQRRFNRSSGGAHTVHRFITLANSFHARDQKHSELNKRSSGGFRDYRLTLRGALSPNSVPVAGAICSEDDTINSLGSSQLPCIAKRKKSFLSLTELVIPNIHSACNTFSSEFQTSSAIRFSQAPRWPETPCSSPLRV
jgi:hypothetical protein